MPLWKWLSPRASAALHRDTASLPCLPPGPRSSEEQHAQASSGHRNPRRSTEYGFKIVAQGCYPIVDIIAIHGLDGHRLGSFTDPSSNVLWLDKFLSKQCPRARIASYGYNAAIGGEADQLSAQCMHGHGADFIRKLVHWRKNTETDRLRPIIFVAHSVGGLVLKHALIIANDGHDGHMPDDAVVKKATYGIIFLGTPHHGVEAKDIDVFLCNIAQLYASSDHPVISNLQTHSRHLYQQIEAYKEISSDFVTRLVYERPTAEQNSQESHLVHLSARYHMCRFVDSSKTASFDKDHVNLVRFSSETDVDYQTLVSWIEKMIEECREQPRGR